jgi:pimeloyl-ACP methyl ester carboxylesterase
VEAIPPVEGVEHRYVEAGGLRVHVAEAGPATAPPILLLHGWPQHWYLWRRVIGALDADHRLIAPDLRGFGWTDAPGHGYDPDTFAADQIALLDALGLGRVRVAGHDWGGYTAFLLVLRHPDRVERALAFNAPHPWPARSPALALELWRTWYAALNALPVVGRYSAARGFSRHILTHGNVGRPFTDEDLELFSAQFREPDRALASVSLYRSYFRAFARLLGGSGAELGRLTAPIRLVFGARDVYVTPKLLPGWERHADDMKVELVRDSGHFIVDEKPDLVSDRIRTFLGEGEGR